MRDELYKDVFDRIQARECQSALKLVYDGLARSPDDAYLLYYAGLAHRRLNNYEEAIRFYQRSIETDSRNASAHLGLGIVYQLKEMYQNAIESLKAAIKLDPDFPEAHNSLGLTYSKVGNYREALRCYQLASEAIIEIAYRQRMGQAEKPFTSQMTTDGKRTLLIAPEALGQIEVILKSNPIWAINRNNIACCLAALGEKECAKEMFEESIKFIPEGSKYDAPFLGLKDLAHE